MSKHHHHPNEGHGDGDPPGSARKPLHHNWFFWVAGLFILVALISFILEGGGLRPGAPPPQPTPSSSGGK